jgi:hypothetical protein
MRTAILAGGLALVCFGVAAPSRAETIVIDDQVQLRQSGIDTPARGSSMKSVEARFGAPETRHAAVGKPPITRWDYPGFSVYFEHEHVVHAVASAPQGAAP